MTPRTAIVIGAGVGGLSAAIHLRRHGLHVTVLEKNAHAGGRCDRFEREGHRFDTGPTLFVMPLVYEAEFRLLGASMHERLDLQRVDPTYHLVFDDGASLALTSDMEAMRRQVEAMQPAGYEGLRRYLAEGERHYRLTLENLVERDIRGPADFFTLTNLSLLVRLKPFVHHYANMRRYFDDPRLKAAFTFQDIYMGLSPFEGPATFSLLPYTELAHGVYYPRGGMYRIVEALAQMAREAGVEIAFQSAVERIETNAHAVHGVRLADGASLEADVIVANADLPYVYGELLPKEAAGRHLKRRHYSCSVISFFWGVDKRYEALGAHTLFLADDFAANFRSINKEHGLPANPSVYIHAPARLDSNMAPDGQDTLIAIVPVGHMTADGEQDWDAMRDEARRQVFRRLRTLGIHDLEAHIKFEQTCSPPQWKNRYNLVNGSTHGLAHTLTQLAWLRPSSRHARYRNLYFAGASTHPGTGLPTAMVSGRLVAGRVMDEL